jgi:hypothetical protein
MEFIKNTAAITSLFATLGSNPGWLCFAVFLFVCPKLLDSVAKIIEALRKK